MRSPNAVASLGVVVALVSGVLLGAGVWGNASPREERDAGTIRVRRIEVVDAKGQVVAVIGSGIGDKTRGTFTGLSVNTGKGMTVVGTGSIGRLAAAASGSDGAAPVTFLGSFEIGPKGGGTPGHLAGVGTMAGKRGSMLGLVDGEPGALLGDMERGACVGMAARADCTRVILRDGEGKARVVEP